MYKCKAGQHEWEKEEDASKCCNGWIRLPAPWLYGQKKVLDYTQSGALHSVNIWKYVWIEESDVEEIAALQAMYRHKVSMAQ